MSENLLEIKNLAVTLNAARGIVRAVRNVNLTIKPGEIHGLVGESGSGKSVTARSVLRLNDEAATLYEGNILFNGGDVLGFSKREVLDFRCHKVAMIFQDPVTSLDPLQRIGSQIAEKLSLAGTPKSEIPAKVTALLESVGIYPAEERQRQYPFQMSGGMLQRVNIAMALAGDPKLLVADEPTTALDVTVQMQILRLLKDLQKRFGMTVLIITHNFGVIAEICDCVSVMYKGVIVEQGDVKSIFDKPCHPYTQGLMAAIPKPGPGQQLPLPMSEDFVDPLDSQFSVGVDSDKRLRTPIMKQLSSTHSYATFQGRVKEEL